MNLTRDLINGSYVIHFNDDELDTVMTVFSRAVNTWPHPPGEVMEIHDMLKSEIINRGEK